MVQEKLNPPVEETPKDKKPERPPEPDLVEFLKELDKEKDLEAKLKKALDRMEQALAAKSGTPHFRLVWELKKICLDLFKENINPSARVDLWGRYRELADEVKRVKNELDEESAFAAQQIEKAIIGIEEDLAHLTDRIEHQAHIDFPDSFVLRPKFEVYEAWQRELSLLNAFATRVNTLRKELIHTDMRVRFKNQFFQRLSKVGDGVFPRRKELIKTISEAFAQDVKGFISEYFERKGEKKPPYVLREEIKALQAVAKLLTLNTHSFTETRSALSQCWDSIKEVEKQRKKELSEKREVFLENKQKLEEKIKAISDEFAEGKLSTDETGKRLDGVFKEMRKVELGRDEVSSLKEQLQEVKKALAAKRSEEEEVRQKAQREQEEKRQQRLKAFNEKLTALTEADQTPAELISVVEELKKEAASLPFSKQEKQAIEKTLRTQRRQALDKQEAEALSQLSDDDRTAMTQLSELKTQQEKRRTRIREQLETYRKASGGSGMDFEQAMAYDDLIKEEKAHLEKIELSIKEINEKLKALKVDG